MGLQDGMVSASACNLSRLLDQMMLLCSAMREMLKIRSEPQRYIDIRKKTSIDQDK